MCAAQLCVYISCVRWYDCEGYVVLGSNGESTHLTVDERVEMVRRVRMLAGRHQLVVAGAGCECEAMSDVSASATNGIMALYKFRIIIIIIIIIIITIIIRILGQSVNQST